MANVLPGQICVAKVLPWQWIIKGLIEPKCSRNELKVLVKGLRRAKSSVQSSFQGNFNKVKEEKSEEL